MTNMLILEPRLVVVIPPSPSPSLPWKDQDIVRGWSPEVTIQEIWAKSPSFITSLAKEKAPISGSSKDYFGKNGNENKFLIIRGHNSAEAGFTTYESSSDWLVVAVTPIVPLSFHSFRSKVKHKTFDILIVSLDFNLCMFTVIKQKMNNRESPCSTVRTSGAGSEQAGPV